MHPIERLTDDIHSLVDNADTTPVNDENIVTLASNIAGHVRAMFNREPRVRAANKLYISELGTKCVRQLWYKVNMPELGEKLPPAAKIKFLYGSILEELVLFLCKEAGHDVKDEQKPVQHSLTVLDENGRPTYLTASGRRDATIDGCVVDVKSTSPYGYDKIVRDRLPPEKDTFGYIEQVSGYVSSEAEMDNPKGILAIDKQNGHIGFTETPYVAPALNMARVAPAFNKEKLPDRGFEDKPYGSSGNMALCTECSYCAFKTECWTGLRGFSYSGKPVFLTKVFKEPKVPELVMNVREDDDA